MIGDVIVGGSYSNGGNGSITGDLTYYGSATGTGRVTGTITHATTGGFPAINMTALGNTLITAATAEGAGATYNSSQTNKNFNFNSISGTNKVIYVKGNVTTPTFTGTGTLYVTGHRQRGSIWHFQQSGEYRRQGLDHDFNNITF